MCLCDRPLTHSSYVCRCVRLGWRTCTSPNPGSQATRVGKSLIFPIPLFLLPKFDAGKPGGESVSVLLYSKTLTEFSGQAGRRVRECVSVYRRAPRVFRECSAVQHCAPRVFRINQRAARARGQGALQRGRLHHKPVLGQEQFQARAARRAQEWGEQSCCHSRIGWSNPVATAGLTRAILLPQQD